MPVCGPCKLLFANAILEHESRVDCKLSSATTVAAWRLYCANKDCSPTSAIAIAHLDLLPPIGTIKVGKYTAMARAPSTISYDADWHKSYLRTYPLGGFAQLSLRPMPTNVVWKPC